MIKIIKFKDNSEIRIYKSEFVFVIDIYKHNKLVYSDLIN